MRKPYKIEGRKGYWMNLPNAKGKITRRKIADTKTKADEYFKAYLANNEAATLGDPLFETVAICWVRDSLIPRVKDGDLSQAFKTRAAMTCDRFVTQHPNHRVSQVTAHTVSQWLSDKASSYRRTEYAALKQCLQWATDYGLIDKNPLAKLRLPSNQPQTETQVIDLAAHKQILEHVSAEAKLLLELLWHTGARPGELASLQWDWINDDLSVATLPKHKTQRQGKQRRIYFSKPAQAILRKCRKLFKGPHVLQNTRGNVWNKDSVRLVLDRAADAGAPKANAYAYRHSYATRALASGSIDLATAAELLGHSSTEMLVRRYAHLSQVKQHLAKAVNKLN